MSVTKDQATEILNRINNGERYPVICLDMGISESDSLAWERENYNEMIKAKMSKATKKS